VLARAVVNDQAALEALLDRAAGHGTLGLVTGQRGSIAQLALAVAAWRGTPVAYVPGLAMRRAADLYPGEAKSDRRDAYVLADTGRPRRRQVHWLDAGSDELRHRPRELPTWRAGLLGPGASASAGLSEIKRAARVRRSWHLGCVSRCGGTVAGPARTGPRCAGRCLRTGRSGRAQR
jgi:hypothetical protein